MKEKIPLSDLTINEDGSFSLPLSDRLENIVEKNAIKSSLNRNCTNRDCNGSENVNCTNQESCDNAINQTRCKGGYEILF